MNLLRRTARRSTLTATAMRWARLTRPIVSTVLAGTLVGGPLSPAFAQDPGQAPPKQEQHPPLPVPQSPEQNRPAQDPNASKQEPKPAYGPGPTNPPIPVSLGASKYSYRRAPKPFPNLIAPYRAISIPQPALTNSPRVDQLVRDGKLELTLQDAV